MSARSIIVLNVSCGDRCNVCPARAWRATLVLTIPTLTPKFSLPWKSRPSGPEWTANLPYKAQQHKANQLNSISMHVTCLVSNKQYCTVLCLP